MTGKSLKRKIVRIDEARCNGCGQCVTACVEGAIALVGGKARLVKDSYCDGLGACLGECPEGAISIEEREAAAFDQAAAKAHQQSQPAAAPEGAAAALPCGCPGTAVRALQPAAAEAWPSRGAPPQASQLAQWPIQLALIPPTAPFLRGKELTLLADCVGFAFPALHAEVLAGRAVAVACPKLDDVAARGYVEKLAAILAANAIPKLTVYRMEVPCCAGLTRIAQEALRASGTETPFEEVVIAIQGGRLGPS
jgi:Pyruvate/2-oxoacid:ferredoxin oxidoreductase delta subunit